ncbi:MAG: Flp pilus assembly protein CpaB [Bdellovibrionota bacterium]
MAIRKNTKKRKYRKNFGVNLFGFGLIAASILFAAFLIKSGEKDATSNQKTAPIVAQFDTVKVPVPAEPVPAGTKISEVKLKQVSYPAHQIPEGALRDLSQYTEAVAIARMPANIPVFRENLSFADSASNPVIDQIPKGMRAMTIRVDATTAVEGWAGSGTIVDVLLVEKDKTTVIAEAVKILSAERSVSPVEGSSAPKLPTTVTMLVSQDQCLAINTSIPRGKIAFALRSTEDIEAWDSTVFTSDSLKGGVRSAQVEENINGVVTIKDNKSSQSYALAGGKWVPTEVVPEGFFVAEQRIK